jgi:fluoride ion exporter CrcB/FEX
MVLFERGATTAALIYVVGSVVLSLLAAFAGLSVGRTLL